MHLQVKYFTARHILNNVTYFQCGPGSVVGIATA